MAKNNLNVAVIGCSRIMGRIHMTGVSKMEGATLYAICDTANDGRLEEAKEMFNVPIAVTDYRVLVDDPNIDIAVIVTPDMCHLEMTVAFLRAGKDVLCEKPMALTVEECTEMRRVEKETGRRLMIGQVCRYTDAFVMAKQLIDSGRIGELYFVESEYAHDYSKKPGYNGWRVCPEREGFIGGGCHAVDLLRWIAGNPTEVYAHATHKCLTDWPVNDATIAIYKFPNNVMGKVFVSIGCKRNYTMRSVFYGTKGTIICDNTSPTLTLFEGEDFTNPQQLEVYIDNHNTKAEIEEFVSAIIEDKDTRVSSSEGAYTISVCCATVESAAKGTPINIVYPEV